MFIYLYVPLASIDFGSKEPANFLLGISLKFGPTHSIVTSPNLNLSDPTEPC